MNTDSWELGLEAKDGRWLVARIDADWRIACRVVRQEQTVVIAEVCIDAATETLPMGGIDSVIYRKGGIGGVFRAARKPGVVTGLFRDAEDPEAVQRYLRSGRRCNRPAKLAAIALLYDQAVRDGHEAVLEVMAAATGLKYTTVRDWTAKARRHDPPLLTGGGRGRDGGEATDEAHRIAQEHGFRWAPAGTASATATAYPATARTG